MNDNTTDFGAAHLGDYLAILRRRRKQVLFTAAAVFAASAILAIVIPPVYRSTAVVLVEQPEVPEAMVKTTVTGYVAQRLRIIQQRVLTKESLLRIIEKHGLNVGEEAESPTDRIVGRMRANILVEPVSDSVPGSSQKTTTAFLLSYDAAEPEVAQKVTEELVQLFLDENQKIRTEQAESASGFLATEEDRLRQFIAELEEKLAAYKERNAGRLPQLMGLNMSLLERSQKELEDLEAQIYSQEERKLQLQSQLATVEPYSGKSAGGRLREAHAEYVSAAAVYSQDHPDVVRLRREIEQLKREAGVVDDRGAIEVEIRRARTELAEMQQKYAADHPDVVRRQNALNLLEERARNAPSSSRLGLAIKPDNPAYIAVQTQLATVDLSLKAAREQKARAQEKLAEYEGRLVQTPRVEQEGLALQREYDNAVSRYRELKQSLMGAELALNLERGQRGERFSLLEPPKLPASPQIPNRRAFLLLGLVLGVGGGVGYASMAEYMDRTVRGARSIASVTGALPLGVIPDLSLERAG